PGLRRTAGQPGQAAAAGRLSDPRSASAEGRASPAKSMRAELTENPAGGVTYCETVITLSTCGVAVLGGSVRTRKMDSTPPAAAHPGRLHQWWLNRSVRAKGIIVVAVPLISLIAITSASLVLQANERQERTAGRAASNVSSAAQQVM